MFLFRLTSHSRSPARHACRNLSSDLLRFCLALQPDLLRPMPIFCLENRRQTRSTHHPASPSLIGTALLIHTYCGIPPRMGLCIISESHAASQWPEWKKAERPQIIRCGQFVSTGQSRPSHQRFAGGFSVWLGANLNSVSASG